MLGTGLGRKELGGLTGKFHLILTGKRMQQMGGCRKWEASGVKALTGEKRDLVSGVGRGGVER